MGYYSIFMSIMALPAFLARNGRPLMLFSILIPSTLGALYFSNTSRQSIEWHTTTLDAVKWNMTRPANGTFSILMNITNGLSAEGINVSFTLLIGSYLENDGSICFNESSDCLSFLVYVSARIDNGYLIAVNTRFTLLEESTLLEILASAPYLQTHNLTVNTIGEFIALRPYLEATATGTPSGASLVFASRWMFLDNNNLSHDMVVMLEAYYYLDSSYHELLMPIRLGVHLP